MLIYQNTARSLAFLVTDGTTGIGITGILWNDAGLSVFYTKHGGTRTQYVLSNSNWHEIGDGVYTVDFTADCFSVLGEFIHTCKYTGATDYIGIIDVITNPLGTGNISWVYPVTINGVPYAGATVVFYSDSLYANPIVNGVTNAIGEVTFMLNAGTYYVKVYVPGLDVQLDTEVVA